MPLGQDVAAISYRFRGRRWSDMVYEAQMTSTWTRADDGWLMAVHQQTPRAAA